MDTKKIISLLGGNAKTAKLCQVTPGAVSQWLHVGIPKHQLKFLKLARPDVFAEIVPQDDVAEAKSNRNSASARMATPKTTTTSVSDVTELTLNNIDK